LSKFLLGQAERCSMLDDEAGEFFELTEPTLLLLILSASLSSLGASLSGAGPHGTYLGHDASFHKMRAYHF
jgi:hypothetical protein